MSAGDTLSGAATSLVQATKNGADSRPVDWAARLGLTARGVVYLLLGLLAVLVARGARAEVDQKGVLEQIIARPFGGAVVALLALGFACYSLWRLSEAVFGVDRREAGAWPADQVAGPRAGLRLPRRHRGRSAVRLERPRRRPSRRR